MSFEVLDLETGDLKLRVCLPLGKYSSTKMTARSCCPGVIIKSAPCHSLTISVWMILLVTPLSPFSFPKGTRIHI